MKEEARKFSNQFKIDINLRSKKDIYSTGDELLVDDININNNVNNIYNDITINNNDDSNNQLLVNSSCNFKIKSNEKETRNVKST